jgi:hypothetical protein
MGVSYSKVHDNQFFTETPFPMNIQPYAVNPDRVGETYIVVFKLDAINQKVAHQAIVIDVAGASNDSNLCGVTLHLTADALTKISTYRAGDSNWPRTDFYEVIPVGRLRPTHSNPRYWSFQLHLQVSNNTLD